MVLDEPIKLKDKGHQMYYEHTRLAVGTELFNRYQKPEPNPDGIEDDLPGYLLWMTREVGNMSPDIPGSLKAARWIGRILRCCEELFEDWDNARSRDLIREDKALGNHLPEEGRCQ